MTRMVGRPAKEAWRTRERSAAELKRGWPGEGEKALAVRITNVRAAAEAAHFLSAVGGAKRALHQAATDLGAATDDLWARRDASLWTSHGSESSRLWAETVETIGDLKKLRDQLVFLTGEAQLLAAKVASESSDRRRNELNRTILREVAKVAPQVASSGTAMAYWQLACFGLDLERLGEVKPGKVQRPSGYAPESDAEFKRVVAKWIKAIKREQAEARASKRRRVS